MENYQQMNRQDFMNFFRDDEKLNELSADDRAEIFSSILTGSSDFTKEFLSAILSDYCVENIKVVEINKEEK